MTINNETVVGAFLGDQTGLPVNMVGFFPLSFGYAEHALADIDLDQLSQPDESKKS